MASGRADAPGGRPTLSSRRVGPVRPLPKMLGSLCAATMHDGARLYRRDARSVSGSYRHPGGWYILRKRWARRQKGSLPGTRESGSAKKPVIPTYLQYVIVTLGVLLLWAFWMLFATLAATAICGVVGAVFTVSVIVTTLPQVRETLLFEHWRKTLIIQIPPEPRPVRPRRR